MCYGTNEVVTKQVITQFCCTHFLYVHSDCRNKENYLDVLNTTCEEVTTVDDECTGFKKIPMNPLYPPAKLYTAYVCCESCGKN